jgi:hypothetical protein
MFLNQARGKITLCFQPGLVFQPLSKSQPPLFLQLEHESDFLMTYIMHFSCPIDSIEVRQAIETLWITALDTNAIVSIWYSNLPEKVKLSKVIRIHLRLYILVLFFLVQEICP